jgi:hypothetical protein
VVVDVDRDRGVHAARAAAAYDLEPFEGPAQLGAPLGCEPEGDIPGGTNREGSGEP